MQRDHTDTQFKRLSENLETAEAGEVPAKADLHENRKNIRLCLMMRQQFGLKRALELHNKAESE